MVADRFMLFLFVVSFACEILELALAHPGLSPFAGALPGELGAHESTLLLTYCRHFVPLVESEASARNGDIVPAAPQALYYRSRGPRR